MEILQDATERAAFEAIAGHPDRVVAIVAGSILENRVTDLIKVILRNDRKVWNELFTGVGPAAPYSVKLKIAYMIRIIDKETFDDLNYIRKIRNPFAHDIAIDSFDHTDISNLVTKLPTYVKTMEILNGYTPDELTSKFPHMFMEYFRREFSTNRGIFLSVCRHCIAKIVRAESDAKSGLQGIRIAS